MALGAASGPLVTRLVRRAPREGRSRWAGKDDEGPGWWTVTDRAVLIPGEVIVRTLLKQFHRLPLPDLRLDPFVRVAERIEAVTSLSEDDRDWLRHRHAGLREQWERVFTGLPECVVHGDAWVGNVAHTPEGPVLLDFERASIGPPEWDLVFTTAVRTTTIGVVTEAQYTQFCGAYGTDVTKREGYELLAGARELRMSLYAAQHTAMRPERQAEARYRVDCLRGRTEPRPWHWQGGM